MNIENVDIKDLVLVGGGLFTLAIVLHGIWLAWRARKEPLRLEISHDLIPEEDEDDLAYLRGELPNGGGRPVRPLQKDLDFDSAAPVLLDPVETPEPASVETASETSPWPDDAPPEPQPDFSEELAEEWVEEEVVAPIRAGGAEPVLPDTGPIVAQDSRRSRSGERYGEHGESFSERGERVSEHKEPEPPRETRPAPADPGDQELLVINLFAPDNGSYRGESLLAAMRAQGLKFGEMNIFHRYDPLTRDLRFSVANVVEPGYFDLAEISDMVSPGLVFFMQLPGPDRPVEAVEDMLAITRAIADELGALLHDENMNVLTPQTMEHYRERVADFSRRRLSMRVGVA